MKNSNRISLVIFALARFGSAQKPNHAITLNYDASSNATKITVTGDNFVVSEAKAAGIQAMNFGLAFFYAGKELATWNTSISRKPAITSKRSLTPGMLNSGSVLPNSLLAQPKLPRLNRFCGVGRSLIPVEISDTLQAEEHM